MKNETIRTVTSNFLRDYDEGPDRVSIKPGTYGTFQNILNNPGTISSLCVIKCEYLSRRALACVCTSQFSKPGFK